MNIEYQGRDELLICSNCKEPLENKPILSSQSLVATITILAFISPLIMWTLVLINQERQNKINIETINQTSLLRVP